MNLPSPLMLTVTLALLLTAAILAPLTRPLDWNGNFVEARQDLCSEKPRAIARNRDPWGNQYLSTGGIRYSAGPNGQDEGSRGDDISCDTPLPRRPVGMISYVLLGACVLCLIALTWRVLSRDGRHAA